MEHHEWGKGKITRVVARRGVLGACVDFGWLRDWFPFVELGLVDGEDRMPDNPDEGSSAAYDGIIGEAEAGARRAVLALKLGQAPVDRILDLSVGADDARRAMEEAIESVAGRRQPASILFRAQYGTGKTHLLTMLRALAGRSGLATASVVLDGVGVTLSEPMGLMAALLDSLIFPGEAMASPLVTKLASIRNAPRRQFPYHNRIIDAVFRIPADAFDDPDVMNEISEYFMLQLRAYLANRRLPGFTLVPLSAWRVDDRAERFCELLHGWVEVVSQSCKGLVWVIDELDVEYDQTARDTQHNSKLRDRRMMLLDKIRALFEDHKIPLLIAFGVAPDFRAAVGPAGNDAVGDLRNSFANLVEIMVPTHDLAATKILGRRLRELYAAAYPHRVVDQEDSKRLIDRFAEELHGNSYYLPRTFVREALDLLDVM